MHLGGSTLKLNYQHPGDIVHTALLEVFPQLGVDVRYESILNLIIDAKAGCSAAVPLESITVVITVITDCSCEVLIDGYVRRDPGQPRDFVYPSNCGDISRALDQRLGSPLPICPVSFQEQLRIRYGDRPRQKSSRLWLLVTVLCWGGIGYWLLK